LRIPILMGGDAVAAQCFGAIERVVGLLHQMRGVVLLAEVVCSATASCSSFSLSMFEGLVMDFETRCKPWVMNGYCASSARP
jgi:hypothetical protein